MRQPEQRRRYLEAARGASRFIAAFNALLIAAKTRELFAGQNVKVAVGGATRQETVSRLLRHATRPLVLLHEVARPFVSPELFEQILAAAAEAGAASLYLPLEPRDSMALTEDGNLGEILAATISGQTYDLVEGTALAADVADSNTVAGSLSRSPGGSDTNDAATDWVFTTTVTKGTANVISG